MLRTPTMSIARLTRCCSLLRSSSPSISHLLGKKTAVARFSDASKLHFGKGSLPLQTRLYGSVPPLPGMVELDLDHPSVDDIQIADDVTETKDTAVKFSSFPLGDEVVAKLKSMGCDETFEIQEKTLPLTLNGRDVIGRAVTGSGKTLAYALPIIHILSNTPRTREPRAIVITPTRELCNQVYKSIQSLSNDLRCMPIYGGASYDGQESALARGVDVICATPGRLNDHLNRGNFCLDNIKFLILDEADELLTPNFKVQIENILEDCPKDKQMMLFSATLPPNIKSITKRYMNDAELVDLVANRSLVPEGIIHQYMTTRPNNKMYVVPDLLYTHQSRRALVFTPTRAQTHTLGSLLTNLGFKAASLNSDMSQTARDACFKNFKEGIINVLVATDVAARGLDVPELDLVIQVDIPPNGVDFYIHRSGRTGRMGQSGKTILVASKTSRKGPNLYDFMNDLEDIGIHMDEIKAPSVSEVTQILLKNAASRLNPEMVSREALELTMPFAKELMDKHGTDALAAALVSLSNLDSRLKAELEQRTAKNYRENYDDRGNRSARSGFPSERSGRGYDSRNRDTGRYGSRDRYGGGRFGDYDRPQSRKYGRQDRDRVGGGRNSWSENTENKKNFSKRHEFSHEDFTTKLKDSGSGDNFDWDLK